MGHPPAAEHAWHATVHVVRCAERKEVRDAAGAGHTHVTALGVEDADGSIARLETVEVIDHFRRGDRFVTPDSGGYQLSVEPAVCPRCRTATLAAPALDGADQVQRLSPCGSFEPGAAE